MGWWLFLDDEREPVGEANWVVARSFEEAKILVMLNGVPDFITFDHDLGYDSKTGSDFATWLIDHMLDNDMRFPLKFTYEVHSQNPVGSNNIKSKMDSALKHIGME